MECKVEDKALLDLILFLECKHFNLYSKCWELLKGLSESLEISQLSQQKSKLVYLISYRIGVPGGTFRRR
ncbi:hypothetical protein Hdeb2414_s0004g00129761 [Helianthus debilis subsp. tardiflorus]